MNILIITTCFPSYEKKTFAGKFVLHEALAYAKNGAKVKVLTPYFQGAPKIEILEYGVEVVRFKYFFLDKYHKLISEKSAIYDNLNLISIINIPFFIVSFLYNVWKHSKGISIVHCQWTTTVLFALPFRKIRKFKIVTTARGSDIRLFPKWLNKFIMRKVDASINCYGEGWFQTLKNFPSNYIKLPLITNSDYNVTKMPEDLENVLKNRMNYFKIVYLGRFDKVKHEIYSTPFLMLIDSINELKKSGYNNIIAVYIGSGNWLHQIVSKIKEYNLEDTVFLLGSKLNPELYLPFFDLGVGGSFTDAVTQEMAFANLPQVQINYLPDNPVCPWEDKKEVIHFEPHNVGSLTKAIKFAIENPETLKIIAENMKNGIKKYALGYDEGGAAYLNEFKKLLTK